MKEFQVNGTTSLSLALFTDVTNSRHVYKHQRFHSQSSPLNYQKLVFSSHGLRTGIFEATRIVLINVAPNLQDLQVQSMASFCSTILGTSVRIPCEVLKQRIQAGIFNNVGEANSHYLSGKGEGVQQKIWRKAARNTNQEEDVATEHED